MLLLTSTSFSQSAEGAGPWSIGLGSSKSILQTNYYSIRFISPRFKFETTDDYWTEEQEKHPSKFKKDKFLFEVLIAKKLNENIYSPQSIVAASLYHSFIKAKFVQVAGSVGLKYAINTTTMRHGFGPASNEKIGLCFGLMTEFNLRFILPYIDFNAAGYVTVGAEFHLRKIYRKLNRRYDLDLED